MYDLGAKMDVFLRCNAVKMFKGRTVPYIGSRAEFREILSLYYLTTKAMLNCFRIYELF